MVRLDFDLVQTSCGDGVPLFDYIEERPQMDAWARAKGVDGIEAYWRDKNQKSLDGFPSGLFDPLTKMRQATAGIRNPAYFSRCEQESDAE